MKKHLLDFTDKDINIQNKPFYKRRLFFIGIGISLLLIIIIIIIICASLSSSPLKFSSKSFIESSEPINNPDRGFYYPISVKITPESLSYYMTDHPQQIYHLRCDIGEFSGAVNSEKIDKELTTKALEGLQELLSTIKSKNKNVLIRFCYDNYKGISDLEPNLSMIEKHIKQLSSVLNKYTDTVTAIEAGMLGRWGEMHSSVIATNENKALIFKYWLENTKEIPILARTPIAIFTYFNKSLDEMEKFKINKNDKGGRLGIFNDCFLSSFNDYYTYVINITREMNWLSKVNENLPFGGETCNVCERSDLEIAIPEMRFLSLSHLNIVYKQDVIEKWKNLTYSSALGNDFLFYGVSGYYYIDTHIGYRLVIRSIDVEYKTGGKFELNINIENVGFGNLFKSKKVDLLYTDLKNNIINREEMGNYNGENVIKIKGKLLKENHDEYKVFIRLYSSYENNTVYYPVQFANDKIYDDNIKAHLLFYVEKGGKIHK